MSETIARVRCTTRTGETGELTLLHDSPDANVKLALDQFYRFVSGVSQNLAIDLIRIAAFVYVADTSFSRGGVTDVYQEDWPRDFSFRIPLLEPNRWAKPRVVDCLIPCLKFLTGDDYDFKFVSWSQKGRQEHLRLFDSANVGIGADCVSLLSGGLDSLCAAARLREIGRNPLLIGHRSGTRLWGARRELMQALHDNCGWNNHHWAVQIHRIGTEARERSRRSRAFLYAALGAAAALSLGVRDIYLCDNGVVSLNLVFSKMAAGTALTRSTHPKFLRDFTALLRELGCEGLTLRNGLLDFTKGEVFSELGRLGLGQLIPFTISCARPHMTSVLQNHCGGCSQCLDRRFGSEFAGMAGTDALERYALDVFTSDLKGDDLSAAETLVRWAREMAQMSFDQFLERAPQILEAVVPESPADEQLEAFYRLHIRHANQVLSVLEAKYREHANKLALGSLGSTCLLRIGADQNVDELDRFSVQLGNRLDASLPTFFRHRVPANETEVQDAVDGLLRGWASDLRRENPAVRFATRNFKPDFTEGGFSLSIEVKYPRETRRIGSIVNEMASDAHAHRKAKKNLFFILYDPQRAIADDAEFARDFRETKPPRVFIKIIH